MILSKEQMQLIVEELEASIHRHVNIMDIHGCIIASTDDQRIGMVHGAAKKLLTENLEQLNICYDNEYEGSRQGINMPIIVSGETVGVVGITGQPESVKDLGLILKKMTEILIAEVYQRDQSLLYHNARSAFLYRWLSDELPPKQELETWEQNGRLLGIDVRLPRVAAVLEPYPNSDTLQDVLLQQKLQSGLHDVVTNLTSHSNHIQLPAGNHLLLLCHSTQPQTVELLCKQISDAFLSQYKVPLAVGIGTPGADRHGIIKSYHEAERACYLSLHTKGHNLRHFSSSDFCLLLDEISDQVKLRYVNQIFINCTSDQLEQWMFLLRIFFDADGSINEASKQLYIHKNTLQYRLNKVAQLTGYDPRIYHEAFSLYTALIIYENITKTNK